MGLVEGAQSMYMTASLVVDAETHWIVESL